MLLTNTKIKETITNFLDKHSKELECKVYPFGEIIRREGDKKPYIYIVKEGVFRCLQTYNKKNISYKFYFPLDIIVSGAVLFPDYPSIFSFQSIENNLTDRNFVYEIPFEQWKSFALVYNILNDIPFSVINNGVLELRNMWVEQRRNRNTQSLIKKMLTNKHQIFNSGIPHQYIAEYFGTETGSLHRMMVENNKKTKKR